jgi:hypothetical protein
MSSFRHNQAQQKAGHANQIPIHHVHSFNASQAGDAEPMAFIGQWGSISIDFVNQCLRVHDETVKGGVAIVPFFSGVAAPVFPFTPLEFGPVNIPAGGSLPFTHNFGRFAQVTMLDATTGEERQLDVTHDLARNSFTVFSGNAVSVYIIAQ